MASREEVLSIQEGYLKEVADAIRDKDGTNELIAPVDFPSRIRAISTAVVDNFPAGGSINQALMKNSSEDGDVRWGNVVVTFNGRSGFVFPQEGDYTAQDVGAVPTYRRVNGHELEADIWLTAEDVGALDSNFKGTVEARFDTVESSIFNNSQKINEVSSSLSTEITTKISQAKTEILSQVKAGITKGTTALVSGISPLDTDTIYVQYEP